MKLYSPSTGGFYDEAIHESIPDDCISITDDEWRALRSGNAGGKNIVCVDGVVSLADAEHTTETAKDFIEAIEKTKLDSIIPPHRVAHALSRQSQLNANESKSPEEIEELNAINADFDKIGEVIAYADALSAKAESDPAIDIETGWPV